MLAEVLYIAKAERGKLNSMKVDKDGHRRRR